MNQKRSRSTRRTAMVYAIGVLSAAVLAACSSTADLSTAPLALNRSLASNTDLDPTGFVRICKSGGPAGTYTFDTSVQGGGAHVINFGSGPQLTLDFSGAEVCLNSYLQLGNDPSWTPGMTANVTLTELPTEGLEVAEIQVWDYTNFPQVLVQTVTGSASVTVTVNATRKLKVLYFNRELPPPPPPSANCYAITAVQGVPITPVTLTGSGGTGGPYTFSATGLPAGLTLSTTGVLSGTPTVSGTFSYTVTVKDKDGNEGSGGTCAVDVSVPPSANCVAISAVQGVAITPVTLTGSGGAGGPYTFSATGLPAGLTLSSNGVLSGTPTVSGNFSYTVTVTDKDGNTGSGGTCAVTVSPPPPPPASGCTPGYWKASQHWDSWPTGYTTTQLVGKYFPKASLYSTDGKKLDRYTLVEGLSFQGGSSTSGKAEILLRAGVAALLNSASGFNPAYPFTTAQVISMVNNALNSGNGDTMISVATTLDNANNGGCRLN